MTQVTRPDQIAVEDARLIALDERRKGKNFREIAKVLAAAGGPTSHSRAYELVVEALRDLRDQCREAAQDVRDLEIQRCDGMIAILWERLEKPKISARTAARVVDSILRVQDRKARYLGLDAPKRIEATGAAGAPLLPPGAIAIQLVRPGEPIPPPPDARPPAAETPNSGTTSSSASSSPPAP